MRALGALLIFLSAVFLSGALLERERERAARVGALASFVEYVRTAVENYSMSASEILRSADAELLRGCGYLLDEVPENLAKMCEACVIEDGESKRIFFELAADFGKNYRERQSERCSECARALRQRYESIRAELGTRKKLISALCICIALALIILLL